MFAAGERLEMPVAERLALDHAVDKPAAFGPQLTFPYQSNVHRGGGLRELRPRAGRTVWRAYYQRIGDVLVIAGVGPETQAERAAARALARPEVNQ